VPNRPCCAPRNPHGQDYNAKVLAELLNAKSREINSFLSGQLAPGRTHELNGELLSAGNPASAIRRFSFGLALLVG
jgi:hypothetical protein